MSDVDGYAYGDAPEENYAPDAQASAYPAGGVPVEGSPGLYAGDFVNGEGALGIRRDTPAATTDAGTSPDPYAWVRNLGDHGIASQISDGKVSVFERLAPATNNAPAHFEVVPIDDYVPGQTGDQPAGWRQYAPPPRARQDLSQPVYQDLGAYQRALNCLGGSPIASGALGAFSNSGIPVVMIPDDQDRFVGRLAQGTPAGVVYWNPAGSTLTTDRTPQPGTRNSPNPLDALSDQSSLLGMQSPALGLIHEIGHATSFIQDPITYLNRYAIKLNDGWTNGEERRNISQFETPIALQLGEPTRTNHYSFDDGATGTIHVSDPTLHSPSRDLD